MDLKLPKSYEPRIAEILYNARIPITEDEFNTAQKKIINDYFYENIRPGNHPTSYILGGVPGSGKSTLAKKIKNEHNKKNEDAIIISLDDLLRYHPVYDDLKNGRKTQQKISHNNLRYYAILWAEKIREIALKNRISIIEDQTFSGYYRIEYLTKEANKHNYSTKGVILSTQKNKCKENCEKRKKENPSEVLKKDPSDFWFEKTPSDISKTVFEVLNNNLLDEILIIDSNYKILYPGYYLEKDPSEAKTVFENNYFNKTTINYATKEKLKNMSRLIN